MPAGSRVVGQPCVLFTHNNEGAAISPFLFFLSRLRRRIFGRKIQGRGPIKGRFSETSQVLHTVTQREREREKESWLVSSRFVSLNKKENTVFHPFVVTRAWCARYWQTPYSFHGSFHVFYFNKREQDCKRCVNLRDVQRMTRANRCYDPLVAGWPREYLKNQFFEF